MNTFRVEIRPSERGGPSTAPPEKEAVPGARGSSAAEGSCGVLLATSCALFYCQKAARVRGEAWQAAARAVLAATSRGRRCSEEQRAGQRAWCVHAACTVCACGVHAGCAHRLHVCLGTVLGAHT